VDELQGRSLNHELISALGVIYPNFWAPNLNNVSDDFHRCLIVIKVACYSPYKVGKDGVWVKALLDGQFLDSQCSLFKLTMATNSELVLKKVFNVKPMT